MEKVALGKNAGILFYRSLLQQNLTFYHTGSLKILQRNCKLQRTRIFFLEQFVAMNETLQYEGNFSDNILVVGQTGCGKTSFVQSLGKNKIFGDGLKGGDWVSKFNLTKNRED